ncbi:hypothetical protein TsFJ059_009954 [Trichoderma semiorbis]|uniref:Zn(2)-C6 fungal-type domain-containing protein n=1 Tax=Trichoderma semiorbis TaxID=1491008 RepID=A0A9P8KMU4_9HYPO|nr:hypothetical protein TsFJ059_009954 [Trichoderma semiorbis]
MPYTCQQCVRRKVKCDKTLPSCSSCCKGEFECVYQAPNPPRKRKRKRNEDVHERLVRYERILQERGLLSTSDDKQTHEITQDPVSPERRTGELLSGDGKSRYIGSSLWLNTGPVSIHELSEDEDEDQPVQPAGTNLFTADPISGVLLGGSQTLVHYHPSHKDAMKLWMAHVENVEPICKILHIPTAAKMVETVSQKPSTASKADECLLFAIYHFAVFSMSDEDFIQAYVLFLISIRTQTDPHLFWMLTGIAVRIAQRMGLHRDGEGLGLSPFDVQMRRRLFWQLLPLDGYAGQVSGTGISISPNSWDTKPPLNINDAQFYPGMTHQPEELNGASEMIYCLTKAELSNLYTRTGVETKDASGTIQLKGSGELERLIDEVESTIETKYLRYCDIINPLHFLVLGSVRSATNAVRLRNRISPLMNNTIGDPERKQLCDLALKILDTDCTLYGNPQLRRFRWKIKAVFLWDALMCVVTSLAKAWIFSPMERNSIWSKTADVYSNHPEFLDVKTAFQATVGKLTLKAWAVNPPSDSTPEPDFITTLRSQRKAKVISALDKAENLKTCPNKWFKPNPCKTRLNYPSPCPTVRKPFRMCDSWTCVPGSDETWIDTPCGLTILTEPINVCKEVRGLAGDIGTQFITKAGAICGCFPEALNLLTRDLYQSVQNGADVSEAALPLISSSYKLQMCMADNGFDVKDNKAEVEAANLSPSQGWIVLRAAEIDLGTYADLVTAISPCFTPLGCQPKLISDFFTNYLTKSKELMGDQIDAVLNSWLDIFGNMEKNSQEVVSAAENLVGKVDSIPDKIKMAQNEVCVEEACSQEQVVSFMQKVSSLTAAIHVVEDSKAAAITAFKDMPEIVALTRSVIEAAQAVPDVDYLIDLVKKKALTKVDDIWNAFLVIPKLREIANKIRDSAASIQEFVTGNADHWHNSIQSLRSRWAT